MSAGAGSLHSLDGSIAVVTGAAQGIGLGIAEQLAWDGAAVIMADLQLAKAQTEAEQLRRQGLDAQAAYLDITDTAGVDAFFESVASDRGHLDILVNNDDHIGRPALSFTKRLSDHALARSIAVKRYNFGHMDHTDGGGR